MKRIILGAVVGLFVASCSNNETVSLNQDEIQFNVVANKMAKAADMYCNNALPAEFYVWATYKEGGSNAKTYIDGDHIENENGTWTNKTYVRYWPQGDTETLDFYAHVNAGGAFAWNNGAPKIENFKVDTGVTKQVDLLYAVEMGKSKTTDAVNLNFRHALSQVVFKAKNTNKHLHVIINGVSVHNVAETNTFTYVANSTTNNYDIHKDTGSINNQGTWGTPSSYNDYKVTFENKAVIGNGEVVDLTEITHSGIEDKSNILLMLPQVTAAWNHATTKVPGDEGAYFKISCEIYNVAGTAFAAATDVLLYKGNAVIPVPVNWEQGKKYIYTFAFGQGNAGYDENGEDVLTPITFTVSVDDFEEVSVPDVNMKE